MDISYFSDETAMSKGDYAGCDPCGACGGPVVEGRCDYCGAAQCDVCLAYAPEVQPEADAPDTSLCPTCRAAP